MSTAGWFPDPSGAPQQRYWDGARWTEHTAAAPGTALQPVGSGAPAPVGSGAPMLVAFQAPATNSLATAALVLGILGAVIEWGGILTLAAGVLAIVFGAIGLRRSHITGIGGGKSVAGLVLGCFTIVAYLFWGLVTFGFLLII